MNVILYIGSYSKNSNSTHRADALKRIGNTVIVHDPAAAVAESLKSRFMLAFHYRTGFYFLQWSVRKWLKSFIYDTKPDLIWVNSGELLTPGNLKLLKKLNCPVVIYNNDDPTGNRDSGRFGSMLRSIRYYDLCIVLRKINVKEYMDKGARKVLHIMMSYDEIIHQPFLSLDDIPDKFRSEVAFIGTWMTGENRDKFLIDMINEGVPISIWGDRWEKSPYFVQLKPYWRGAAIYGRDYVAGIQGSKICIGFLSKGNRDLHTRRSVEVPFIGSLLCAERTSEHLEMYKEGEEAVFWSDSAECAKLCKELLLDDEKRERIRLAGMKKVRQFHAGNEDICKEALNVVFAGNGQQHFKVYE